MGIVVSKEGRRGCGYRKVGGTYLVCSAPSKPCGILPLELHSCPTCGAGIKQARGWTWVDPSELFKDARCRTCDAEGTPRAFTYCRFTQVQRAGLLWVGEEFYATPEEYMAEAASQGISRRIKAVPKDYVPGETWVLLAHPKVDFLAQDAVDVALSPWLANRYDEPLPARRPAVFTAFLPERVERIVNGDESQEEIAAIEKAGMVAVKVERLGENLDLGIEPEDQD